MIRKLTFRGKLYLLTAVIILLGILTAALTKGFDSTTSKVVLLLAGLPAVAGKAHNIKARGKRSGTFMKDLSILMGMILGLAVYLLEI